MNRVVVPARQATQSGGIGSLESILGLLKSKKYGICCVTRNAMVLPVLRIRIRDPVPF
jgi:hypothetical protein